MLARASWYWNRLRNMPPAELTHRAREAVRQRTFKFSDRRAQGPDRTRTEGLWTGDFDTAGAQSVQDGIIRGLGDGFVEVLGTQWHRSDGWRVDPATKQEWPLRPAHRIQYRQSSGPDPKPSWEVNRLLFLLAAIPAYRRGADSTVSLVDSYLAEWLSEDIPGHGIAWASGIEVGIRAISMSLLASELPLSASVVERVRTSAGQHAQWLESFPSLYSSANNHRVAELVGLLVLGAVWPGCVSANALRGAEAELQRVLISLFARDGIGREQSPTYAAFTLELAAVALALHNWADASARAAIEERVGPAVSALASFQGFDGSLLRYGDDDDGKLLAVLVPDDEYVDLLAALNGRQLEDEALGTKIFADGGHSVIRTSRPEAILTFDHAPLGWGPIAAHGHADALHFSLYTRSGAWIADPGTYRYHGDSAVRRYFKSSSAHNAPVVDSADSSVMTGDFNWSRVDRAHCQLVSASATPDAVEISAEHDGYARRYGTTVRRTIRQRGNDISVVDELRGTQSRFVVGHTIPGDCMIKSEGDRWMVTREGAREHLLLSFAGADGVEILEPGEATAWYSPRFGTRDPAWFVRVSASGQLVSHISLVEGAGVLTSDAY
jgi:hypothetical protein